ncbi:unnamed protein product [Urochloa decumbens]|uniref:poly(A)-specific ribonuclease n=1 Tax=Urochloa decumbens TaxID=240449 RepID=A0ABC9FQ60_9POAL
MCAAAQAQPGLSMMCGAPLYYPPPPISTAHYSSMPPPAADVMDFDSPAPSTPSGSSSSDTTAPLSDTPPAFSTEAAWAAAARLMPQRLPFGTAARNKYQQGSPTAAACGGAALPPLIKLRSVSVSTPPAQDVMDAGSSAPSTPSDCSSTMETTPSPRGPLPTTFPSPYPAAAFAKPIPRPPRVEARQVWAHNFESEARLIESLLPKFRYAAMDTEFPGTVYRPAGAAYTLTPARRYELLKRNVDALDLIQLGLTLFDSGGRLPLLPGGGAAVWEFNFREFDVLHHRHAPESIAMLRASGVDFSRTRRYGVDAAAFGPRLRKWLRAGAGAGLGRAGLVTFSGGYDLAYLVKAVYGPGYRMPATAAEFEGVARSLIRRPLFDVKEMARLCPADLRGGLDSVAAKLDVSRAVGEAHQAGSDSLLTCHTFVKMRECYFDDDGKLAKVAGVLTDITAY